MAVFGDTLRQARAHKGVTLKEAEVKTRINRHHLLALEEERFHELPALIYQRGFVKNYGIFLDLDPNKLLAMFEDARGDGASDPLPIPSGGGPIEMPNHWSPNFAVIAFLVVMSAVVFAWMYSVYFAPPGSSTTPTEVIPTVTPMKNDTLFGTPIIPQPTSTAKAKAAAMPKKTATAKPSATATAQSTSSSDANSANGGASNIVATDPTATSAAASDSNSSNANASDASVPTETPTTVAAGQLSLDFVASSDIDTLTIIVDGTNVYDGPLASGDATGYIPGANFQVSVSQPDALVIYKDGKSFQMGDSVFSLP